MDSNLEHLLQLSRCLLKQAEAGDWEAVQRLEQERRPLLFSYFESHPAATLPPGAREWVQNLLDIDRRVAELALACRHRIGSQLKDLQRGRSATAAYAANSSG